MRESTTENDNGKFDVSHILVREWFLSIVALPSRSQKTEKVKMVKLLFRRDFALQRGKI